MMRKPGINQSWTIFTSLHGALVKREVTKLRLAKCSQYKRATPYRPKSLQVTAIPCKRCGNSDQVK